MIYDRGENGMDNIRSVFENLDVDIRYLNIRVDKDTDMVLRFNYPYPNSRYILYSLIYIMKKIMSFTIIKSGYLYPYPVNIRSVSVSGK